MTGAHGIAETAGVWNAWSFDFTVIAGIILAGSMYSLGLSRLAGSRTISIRRAAAFHMGLVILGAALVSPLAHFAHELFSAHMVQHLLLMLVAAPALVYGSPRGPVLVALPVRLRRVANDLVFRLRPATRLVRNPVTVWVLNAVVLWAWHLPALYQAALRVQILHVIEHLSFLAVAFLFWSLVISSARRRVAYGATLMLVFTTALQSGGLGAILTFATSPLYPVHALGAAASGLTPLADQQLAGVVMWVPGGIVYFVTMAVLFARWLKLLEEGMPSRAQKSLRVKAGES
jgi:putative membrane protein